MIEMADSMTCFDQPSFKTFIKLGHFNYKLTNNKITKYWWYSVYITLTLKF